MSVLGLLLLSLVAVAVASCAPAAVPRAEDFFGLFFHPFPFPEKTSPVAHDDDDGSFSYHCGTAGGDGTWYYC